MDSSAGRLLFGSSGRTLVKCWHYFVDEQFQRAFLCSLTEAKTCTIGDFVAQLKELLDFLEISKLTLVGLSMGGVIAQGFAADAHERLEKLILMNTVYRRTDAELKGVRSRLKITVDKGLKPVADLALDRWFDDAFRRANPDVVSSIRNRLISNDLTAYSTAYGIFVEADREIGAALKQVRCPTLVMTGELDTGSTPELAYTAISIGFSVCLLFALLVFVQSRRSRKNPPQSQKPNPSDTEN